MRTFFVLTAFTTLALTGSAAPAGRPVQAGTRTAAFDAASIKRNTSGAPGSYVGRQPGGRFRAANATLLELIEFAYDVESFRIAEAPPWVSSDRWDIVATLGAPSSPAPRGTPDDTILALRTLLTARFTLELKSEPRPTPIYALVMARADGRLGPALHPSAIDCLALMAARNSRPAAGAAAVPPAPGTSPPAPGASRGASGPPCEVQGRVGSIQSNGAPLSALASMLARRVQRPVVDRTGLTGGWDFVLTYTPDASQIAPGAVAPGTPLPPADPNAPSLFTALQEQLGLKLDSDRAPMEVLVVEHVEAPSPD
jgi:uncharacterized protein (TIGR03435 family)